MSELSAIERGWYERLQLPPSDLSPEERHRRRAAFRNERVLHRRRCDATGKTIVSLHSEDCPGPVYSQDYWWSDQWSAETYARDYDPNRSFFDQFGDLLRDVPKVASIIVNSENCEFNAFCVGGKNCYMCQRIGDSEDVHYSYLPVQCKDCVDCYNISSCELCYEVIDGTHCYDVRYSQNVANCNESSFLFNCQGCSECFLCFNKRNASYCFNNEQLSKEEYRERVAEFASISTAQQASIWQSFLAQRQQQVVPAHWANLIEDVSGNYISESRDVIESFDVLQAESIAHCRGFTIGKNAADSDFVYHGEECFQTISVANSSHIAFSFASFNNCYDLEYSMFCTTGSNHLFGCVGMSRGEYCILNKRYPKSEWERLRAEIIEQMKETGEWGQFFTPQTSLFAYNETVAHEYFPLSEQEALAQGYRWWHEGEKQSEGNATEVPQLIEETPDAITAEQLVCAESGKRYKIQSAELDLYRRMRVPVPSYCPDVRYKRRIALRNPRRLWQRSCDVSGKAILTSYAPDRPEQVVDYDEYVAMMR